MLAKYLTNNRTKRPVHYLFRNGFAKINLYHANYTSLSVKGNPVQWSSSAGVYSRPNPWLGTADDDGLFDASPLKTLEPIPCSSL